MLPAGVNLEIICFLAVQWGNRVNVRLSKSTWGCGAVMAFGRWHFQCAILSVVKSILGEPDMMLFVLLLMMSTWIVGLVKYRSLPFHYPYVKYRVSGGCVTAGVCRSVCLFWKITLKILNRFFFFFFRCWENAWQWAKNWVTTFWWHSSSRTEFWPLIFFSKIKGDPQS